MLGNQSDCLMRIHCHKVELELLQFKSGGRKEEGKSLFLFLKCWRAIHSCNTPFCYKQGIGQMC